MTALRFEIECGKVLIPIEFALDNEAILNALRNKNDARVIRLLKSEF